MLKFLIQLLSAGSLALVTALGSSAQAAPIYSLTDLGTLGGQFSVATAINDAGQIVGVAETADGGGHATLFNTSGGANRDLGTLGGHNSAAYAVNNAGQIVGEAETAGDEAQEGHSHESHATLFNTSGGANRDLGTLGGHNSAAYAVNNAGQIVGEAETADNEAQEGHSHESHATLFDTSGANRDLGTLGGHNSAAYAVNNAGQIVGEAETADNEAQEGHSHESHATLFDTSGGANRDLGTLGGHNSAAYAINNAGQGVGVAQTANGQAHAALFNTSGGANRDLGGDVSQATAINNAGQIVGGGATGTTELDSFAVLFENDSLFDLNDLIQSTDSLASEVLLISATDINNLGQIVANGAYIGNNIISPPRAFLLTPVAIPEPATLAVIATGVIGLMGRGRRTRQHHQHS